jgi:hypothetical protein
MRIVDEKGRLFGIVNVIDFLAMALVALFVATGVLGFIKIRQRAGLNIAPKKAWKEVIMRCDVAIPEVGLKIKKHDTEYNEDGEPIAEVEDMLLSDLGYSFFHRSEITLRLKILCNEDLGQYTFKGRVLKLGQELEFSPHTYTLRGPIINVLSDSGQFVDAVDIQKTDVHITVRFRTAIPELLKAIKPGDEEKDFYGNTIAKVTRVFNESESKGESFAISSLDLSEGMIEILHKSSIEAELVIRANELDNVFFFKGNSVKVGAPFSLRTDRYDINGVIIDIAEKHA